MKRCCSGFNRAHELRKLHKREIEAFLSDPHKKGLELREAYEIAKEPEAWNSKQNRIVKEAEARGTDEEDMLEDDEEDEQPTKKRKATTNQATAKKAKTSSGGGASKQKAQAKSSSTVSAPRKSVGTEEAEGEESECECLSLAIEGCISDDLRYLQWTLKRKKFEHGDTLYKEAS